MRLTGATGATLGAGAQASVLIVERPLSRIILYLLGFEAGIEGLDLNGDGKIDIVDEVFRNK